MVGLRAHTHCVSREPDDDDDFDEDNVPGYTHPSIGRATSPIPNGDKGKGRAQDQLAPPSGLSPAGVSGNIGTAPPNANAGRRVVGGVQVETR